MKATGIDAWEAFTFWHRGVGTTDGSGWIDANADGQAVSAGSAGTSQLIPNKDFDFWSPDFGLRRASASSSASPESATESPPGARRHPPSGGGAGGRRPLVGNPV